MEPPNTHNSTSMQGYLVVSILGVTEQVERIYEVRSYHGYKQKSKCMRTHVWEALRTVRVQHRGPS